MLGPGLIRSDERQIDVRFHGRRQLALCLFGSFLEPLQCHLVLAQINALIFSKFIGQIIDHPLVEIFTTESYNFV